MKIASFLLLVLALAGLAACGRGATSDTTTANREPAGARPPERCPRRGLSRLQTRHPEAQRHLVPPQPTAAIVCRYRESDHVVDGRPSFPLRLSERKLTPGASLGALVASLDSLPRARPGAVACGSGVSLHYLVAFGYRDAPEVYVRVNYGGCGYALNDFQHSAFRATPGLRTRLNRLLSD